MDYLYSTQISGININNYKANNYNPPFWINWNRIPTCRISGSHWSKCKPREYNLKILTYCRVKSHESWQLNNLIVINRDINPKVPNLMNKGTSNLILGMIMSLLMMAINPHNWLLVKALNNNLINKFLAYHITKV